MEKIQLIQKEKKRMKPVKSKPRKRTRQLRKTPNHQLIKRIRMMKKLMKKIRKFLKIKKSQMRRRNQLIHLLRTQVKRTRPKTKLTVRW